MEKTLEKKPDMPYRDDQFKARFLQDLTLIPIQFTFDLFSILRIRRGW